MTLPFSGDNEAMYQWCASTIERQVELEVYGPKSEAVHAEMLAWLNSDEPALQAARRGDMNPMRQRHPELADLLQPPALDRGRYTRSQSQWKKPALDIVRRVRVLWRTEWKKQRRQRHDISAEEIAARYLGLEVEER